jgi:hypothetical protein
LEFDPDTLRRVDGWAVESLCAPEVHKALPKAPEPPERAVGEQMPPKEPSGIHPGGRDRVQHHQTRFPVQGDIHRKPCLQPGFPTDPVDHP